MRQSLEELDGVFTYICVTDDALGMAKDELAAKPLVLYEADDMVALASEEVAIRAGRRPRDRHVRPVRGRGDGVAAVGESRITYDARGLVEIDGAVPGVAEIDGDTATFDARELTTRKINAELRRAGLRGGRHRRHDREPGREALARRRDPHPLPDHASRAASATSAAG